ncbi:MAG: PEP-CTERM sorting domain-containing protein [Halioglobus sp.]|nr:PEP-CTERM sorting domain-containing protein [Halioglobus sp.]
MIKLVQGIVVSLVVSLHATLGVAAPITYSIDRTVGSGSAVGFIQTDGTTGILNLSNIIDWGFTLSSPNLAGQSPIDIDFASQAASSVAGTGLSATATSLVFDFSNTGSRIWFQGSSLFTPWWGLSTVEICPSGGVPCIGEIIGWAPGNQDPAEVAAHAGRVTFASVVSTVPLPTTLALVGAGLVGLGYRRRRTY